MATGDIEHRELPDELLHEPKGASTASAGTSYIADGEGSGEFKKIPVSSLDITVPAVDDEATGDITNIIAINGNTLAQVATGTLVDLLSYQEIPQEMTVTINKNTVEIYRLYLNLVSIVNSTKEKVSKIDQKLSSVITALKGIGLLKDGEGSN